MVTSTSGDAAMLTSAVPLVWMYLLVVACSECLPRPSANTVIGFMNLFCLCATQHCVNDVSASDPNGNIAGEIRDTH
jgi:hypothetical protein